MKQDFDLITWSFPEEKSVKILPIGDVHLGALEHNAKEWEKFVKWVEEQEDTYLFLLGDLVNNSVKTSKGSVYEDMRPMEQKRRMVEYLKPIRHKILAMVSGNHENRTIREVDMDITGDIASKLDIEDKYRPDMAFVRVQLWKVPATSRFYQTYIFALAHGSTRKKAETFQYAIDGIDAFVSAHTHGENMQRQAKIVVNPRKGTIDYKPVWNIVCSSWLTYGGYAMRKMYLPTDYARADHPQTLILDHRQRHKWITVVD